MGRGPGRAPEGPPRPDARRCRRAHRAPRPLRAALRGGATRDDVVAGPRRLHGLLTVAAIGSPRPTAHRGRQARPARPGAGPGADQVIAPDDVFQRIRFATAARRLDGMDRWAAGRRGRAFECVGRASALQRGGALARGGGRWSPGMPGDERSTGRRSVARAHGDRRLRVWLRPARKDVLFELALRLRRDTPREAGMHSSPLVTTAMHRHDERQRLAP